MPDSPEVNNRGVLSKSDDSWASRSLPDLPGSQAGIPAGSPDSSSLLEIGAKTATFATFAQNIPPLRHFCQESGQNRHFCPESGQNQARIVTFVQNRVSGNPGMTRMTRNRASGSPGMTTLNPETLFGPPKS